MSEPIAPKRQHISKECMVTALVFGAAALLVIWAKLFIPIPGTEAVTDPRELFVTVGAGLTGPIGGVLIGLMAGLLDPTPGWKLIVILAHAAGGAWMGFAYKKLVYERLQMPAMLLGWMGLVVAYYTAFVLPLAIWLTSLFQPALFVQIFGENVSTWQAYAALTWAALPEIGLTTLITTLVMWSLPRKYRRPLW